MPTFRRVTDRRRDGRRGLIVSTALLVSVAAGCTIDLGTLGGDLAQASDINDRGVIVGSSLTSGNQARHAFRKAPGQALVDLDNGAFEASEALAVNNSGVAVGYGHADGVEHAVLWGRDGVAHDLGAGVQSRANGINDDGVVVGNAPAPGAYRAFARDPASDALELLPPARPGGDAFQQAEAINDDGTIVGTEFADGCTGAVLWRGPDHEPVALQAPIGQDFVSALGINDRGDVVGTSTGQGEQRAIVWLAPSYEPIDMTPPDVWYAIAYDINDRRQVVGLVGTHESELAFRWDPRTDEVVLLGGLGGTNSRAFAINAAGVAVGDAYTGTKAADGSPASHAATFLPSPRRH